MTHMSNYGNDRLALYTFESVIKFLQCWTNIKLETAPPLQLGEHYFKLHPEEIEPVWGVSTLLNFHVFLFTLYFISLLFYRIHVRIIDIKKFGQKISHVIHFQVFL